MPIRLSPESVNPAKIKVVGVGGGGGNILNSMVDKGIEGVEFVAINTDIQDLNRSKANVKIQIGKNITKGLGTGMNDEIAFKAVEESREEVLKALEGTDMIFITAGMGGGTGTGAAPAVAHLARGLDALVVAIVTKPFKFEGKPRHTLAETGVEKLKKEVDSLIVIPNQRVLEIINPDTPRKEAFNLVNSVLYNATRGISQIIVKPGEINVDFADVKTIMKDSGEAMMGMGTAHGDDRATKAVHMALTNPILEGTDIAGSRCVLVNICSDGNIRMSEIEHINETVMKAAGENARNIFGVVDDESMGEEIMVTVIATGFNKAGQPVIKQDEYIDPYAYSKRRHILGTNSITQIPTAEELSAFDKPAHLRREIILDDNLEDVERKKEKKDEDFDDLNLDSDFKKPAFLRRQMD